MSSPFGWVWRSSNSEACEVRRSDAVIGILGVLATGSMLAIPLGLIWRLEQRPAGETLLSVSLVCEIVALSLLGLVRSHRRESALRLIAAGGCGDATGRIAAQMTAVLDDPKHRARLAAALLRALHQAECWRELQVARRPPETVRGLASFRGEIEQIVSLVRSGQASAPGLALLELSLVGGYGSVLYSSEPQTVRELLWRIRFLLNQRRHGSS